MAEDEKTPALDTTTIAASTRTKSRWMSIFPYLVLFTTFCGLLHFVTAASDIVRSSYDEAGDCMIKQRVFPSRWITLLWIVVFLVSVFSYLKYIKIVQRLFKDINQNRRFNLMIFANLQCVLAVFWLVVGSCLLWIVADPSSIYQTAAHRVEECYEANWFFWRVTTTLKHPMLRAIRSIAPSLLAHSVLSFIFCVVYASFLSSFLNETTVVRSDPDDDPIYYKEVGGEKKHIKDFIGLYALVSILLDILGFLLWVGLLITAHFVEGFPWDLQLLIVLPFMKIQFLMLYVAVKWFVTYLLFKGVALNRSGCILSFAVFQSIMAVFCFVVFTSSIWIIVNPWDALKCVLNTSQPVYTYTYLFGIFSYDTRMYPMAALAHMAPFFALPSLFMMISCIRNAITAFRCYNYVLKKKQYPRQTGCVIQNQV